MAARRSRIVCVLVYTILSLSFMFMYFLPVQFVILSIFILQSLAIGIFKESRKKKP